MDTIEYATFRYDTVEMENGAYLPGIWKRNIKIFASNVSVRYVVEDSNSDFRNENNAHCNRLLLLYYSTIIGIDRNEYFFDNCEKYSHCSTNSKPNSTYCSSTNNHCVVDILSSWKTWQIFRISHYLALSVDKSAQNRVYAFGTESFQY